VQLIAEHFGRLNADLEGYRVRAWPGINARRSMPFGFPPTWVSTPSAGADKVTVATTGSTGGLATSFHLPRAVSVPVRWRTDCS
jgi:hypothetical protein